MSSFRGQRSALPSTVPVRDNSATSQFQDSIVLILAQDPLSLPSLLLAVVAEENRKGLACLEGFYGIPKSDRNKDEGRGRRREGDLSHDSSMSGEILSI
jgi:hypothetical protein